jgi:cytochrome c556
MRRSMVATRRLGGIAVAAAATLTLSLAIPRAQGGGQPAPQAKPMIPLAASTFATNPDTYVGENVTVTGAVEQTLSKTAFSIDQDKTKATGKDVIVIAPTLQKGVDQNTYITVIGEVVKLDPAEIAKKAKNYAVDLSPELLEKYKGKPVVLATAVVNSAAIDIAKVPPPPMTADDMALSKIMKQVGPANTQLRTALDASNVETSKQHVATLKQMFLETETFWKPKGKADAIQWSADARKAVDSLEKAVAATKWDEAKTAAGALGQTCQQCHGAHRIRIEDGTYRIKTGG